MFESSRSIRPMLYSTSTDGIERVECSTLPGTRLSNAETVANELTTTGLWVAIACGDRVQHEPGIKGLIIGDSRCHHDRPQGPARLFPAAAG